MEKLRELRIPSCSSDRPRIYFLPPTGAPTRPTRAASTRRQSRGRTDEEMNPHGTGSESVDTTREVVVGR